MLQVPVQTSLRPEPATPSLALRTQSYLCLAHPFDTPVQVQKLRCWFDHVQLMIRYTTGNNLIDHSPHMFFDNRSTAACACDPETFPNKLYNQPAMQLPTRITNYTHEMRGVVVPSQEEAAGADK